MAERENNLSGASGIIRRTEKEKMLHGELYRAGDPELRAERERAEALLLELNATGDAGRRISLLRSLLGSVGERVSLRSPFFCDYGYNIHLGDDVFVNFNCVLLDVMSISIGNGTQIGPSVQILAADHPRDEALRRSGLENGKPVTIGSNVWLGAGAILLPGITVGDDAIVGAGSVVTRDVAAGTTVVGNPARVVKRRVEAETPADQTSVSKIFLER